MAILLSFILPIGNALSASQYEKEWLRCEKSKDCASVELGCYYWQPVNKTHAEDMKAKNPVACLKSTPAGPQPETICKDNICDNEYTIGYWKKLEEVPHKNMWIGKKIEACIKEANVKMPKMYDYIEVRTPFIKKINDAVNQRTFSDNKNLQQAIDQTILCSDVVREVKQFEN